MYKTIFSYVSIFNCGTMELYRDMESKMDKYGLKKMDKYILFNDDINFSSQIAELNNFVKEFLVKNKIIISEQSFITDKDISEYDMDDFMVRNLFYYSAYYHNIDLIRKLYTYIDNYDINFFKYLWNNYMNYNVLELFSSIDMNIFTNCDIISFLSGYGNLSEKYDRYDKFLNLQIKISDLPDYYDYHDYLLYLYNSQYLDISESELLDILFDVDNLCESSIDDNVINFINKNDIDYTTHIDKIYENIENNTHDVICYAKLNNFRDNMPEHIKLLLSIYENDITTLEYSIEQIQSCIETYSNILFENMDDYFIIDGYVNDTTKKILVEYLIDLDASTLSHDVLLYIIRYKNYVIDIENYIIKNYKYILTSTILCKELCEDLSKIDWTLYPEILEYVYENTPIFLDYEIFRQIYNAELTNYELLQNIFIHSKNNNFVDLVFLDMDWDKRNEFYNNLIYGTCGYNFDKLLDCYDDYDISIDTLHNIIYFRSECEKIVDIINANNYDNIDERIYRLLIDTKRYDLISLLNEKYNNISDYDFDIDIIFNIDDKKCRDLYDMNLFDISDSIRMKMNCNHELIHECLQDEKFRENLLSFTNITQYEICDYLEKN